MGRVCRLRAAASEKAAEGAARAARGAARVRVARTDMVVSVELVRDEENRADFVNALGPSLYDRAIDVIVTMP